MKLKQRIIRNLEWANKRLKLQDKELNETQLEIIEFCLLHDLKQLTIPVVSKCDCDKDIACIVCGEEKNLDGDFWKNKKKYDNPTHEEIEEDCRNIPN
tara:strand:+ start:3291 stop:3584 length:294 start_codon:yes stop_codon:yes gene_type:complete